MALWRHAHHEQLFFFLVLEAFLGSEQRFFDFFNQLINSLPALFPSIWFFIHSVYRARIKKRCLGGVFGRSSG